MLVDHLILAHDLLIGIIPEENRHSFKTYSCYTQDNLMMTTLSKCHIPQNLPFTGYA